MRTVNVLPSTLRASERERSAEQADKLPADRQSKAGAAVLAADRSVRLPERLKHGLLFVLGDADAGVRDRERDLAVGGARGRSTRPCPVR